MEAHEHKKIMGLDMGMKRIGVAISDDDQIMSHPLNVVQCKNRDHDILTLCQLAREYGVGRIVMGLSRRSDGSLSPTGEKTVRYAKRLERALGLPVVYVDESNTTVEADQVLDAAEVSRDKRRKVVDMLAASLILNRYLEGEREEL